MEILHFLLKTPATPPATTAVEAWAKRHHTIAARFEVPVDAAAAGGFVADRLAWAFASGYQAAIASLLGDRSDTNRAVAVTEAGGNHPRAIESRLVGHPDGGYRLSGRKTHIRACDRTSRSPSAS